MVFPGVPEKEKDRNQRAHKVLEALGHVEAGESRDNLRPLLSEIERDNHTQLERGSRLYRCLLMLLEKIYSECPCDGADNIALMTFFIPYGHHLYSSELYSDIVRLPFENTYVNVPARYDEVLHIVYGNYMQVNKAGGVHDYPVYGEQEQILKENIHRNPFRYTMDFNDLLKSVARYTQSLISPKHASGTRKVVFLPCKASWWKTMEGYWKREKSDPNNEVHVLPIPYYDCDFEGNIGDEHFEKELFPEYLHAEDCTAYDFEKEHPDTIVIQVPYDAYSTAITVHDFFYSDNLLNYTDELVYIPWFDVDDLDSDEDKAVAALSVMIEQPAVVNSDKIVLKSNKMRQLYIDKLIALTEESTRNYWQNKILAEDDAVDGRIGRIADSTKQEAQKKNITYFISIAFLLQGRDKAIAKLRRALDTIAENGGDITCTILPQNLIESDLKRIDEELYWDYKRTLDEYTCRNACFVYDEKGISKDNIDRWDAYYGDPGYLARECQILGKPVMIQNMDV